MDAPVGSARGGGGVMAESMSFGASSNVTFVAAPQHAPLQLRNALKSLTKSRLNSSSSRYALTSAAVPTPACTMKDKTALRVDTVQFSALLALVVTLLEPTSA